MKKIYYLTIIKKNFNGIKYYENESSENIIDVNKLSASNKT